MNRWRRSFAAVYEEGIAAGNATFETAVPSWEVWDAAHGEARLVAERGGGIVGWAAVSPVSDRRCYRGVADESIYVAARARGTGLGRALPDGLIERSETVGIWTLQAGIFPGTRRRFASTSAAASGSWAFASASASWAGCGVTS